jgi:hypothetical protein
MTDLTRTESEPHQYHTEETMANQHIYAGIILQGIFVPVKWLKKCEQSEATHLGDTTAGFLHTCDNI